MVLIWLTDRRTFGIEFQIDKVGLIIAYEIGSGGSTGRERCMNRFILRFTFLGVRVNVGILERHCDQTFLFGRKCGIFMYVGIIFGQSFRLD